MIERTKRWSWVLGALLATCASHNESTSSTQTASPPPATSGAASSEPSAASASPASTSPGEGAASASAAPSATTTSSNASPPPPPELPPMPTGLAGPPTPWEHMNAHQRAEYMDHHIVPAMQALFGAYDPHDFEHVTCATCHGTNAREVHFHMPNRLPTLPQFGTDASRQHMAQHQRMYAFMHERVVPAMAALLAQHPFDMQTHTGFGCGNCHHIGGN